LNTKDLLMKVAAYAGWNTSSNTLGTCIPQGIVYWLVGETPSHLSFLASRYVEDAGYCSIVRKHVGETALVKLGYNYFSVEEQRGIVAEIVKEELIQYVNKFLPTIKDFVVVEDIYMPWRRMFEVGLKISYKK
jgi:hypothetical protein